MKKCYATPCPEFVDFTNFGAEASMLRESKQINFALWNIVGEGRWRTIFRRVGGLVKIKCKINNRVAFVPASSIVKSISNRALH